MKWPPLSDWIFLRLDFPSQITSGSESNAGIFFNPTWSRLYRMISRLLFVVRSVNEMHEYFFLFWWAVCLLHVHANGDFFLNDEGFTDNYLGPFPPSEDFSGPWSTQDLSVDASPVTKPSGLDNTVCPAGTNGFFGRKRIRSSICSGDQGTSSDDDVEDIIGDLEGGWNDDDSAIDDDEGDLLTSLCPDPIHLGHLLPVCSSGSRKDISYAPITGEIKLDWCTLGIFSYLIICPCA